MCSQQHVSAAAAMQPALSAQAACRALLMTANQRCTTQPDTHLIDTPAPSHFWCAPISRACIPAPLPLSLHPPLTGLAASQTQTPAVITPPLVAVSFACYCLTALHPPHPPTTPTAPTRRTTLWRWASSLVLMASGARSRCSSSRTSHGSGSAHQTGGADAARIKCLAGWPAAG